MYHFIKDFPAGLQPMVWRSFVRAEGFAANQAAIPAPPAMLRPHEAVPDDISAVWLPKVTTFGVGTTPIPAYLAHCAALVRVFIA
jgi:hypothetical protein